MDPRPIQPSAGVDIDGSLSPAVLAVWNALLTHGYQHVNTVASKLSLPAGTVSSALSVLRMAGFVDSIKAKHGTGWTYKRLKERGPMQAPRIAVINRKNPRDGGP